MGKANRTGQMPSCPRCIEIAMQAPTPGGLPFQYITVSDEGGEINKTCSAKPVVVISARVHPGEANASWVSVLSPV